MNKIAYCSAWANGVCAEAGQSALFQQSSLESLQRLLKRIDNVVLGANAYRLFTERKVDLTSNHIVLLSKSVSESPAENITLVTAPAEALLHFPQAAEANVLLAGGLSTIDSFMQQGLVDELIMDIEPALTTTTGKLFPSIVKQINLELIGMHKVGAATIQLHYRILR